MRRLLAGLVLLLALPGAAGAAEEDGRRPVVLWHSYRGAEETAFREVIDRFNETHDDVRIDALAIPYQGYASKLTTAIPRDNGPDVFVFAHERIGGWARSGLLEPLDSHLEEGETDAFFPETLTPLRYQGKLYGFPLAFKSVALFYNKALVSEPPATTDEMVEIARRYADDEQRFGLVYESANFYHHAAWYFGFGGKLFGEDGTIQFESEGAIDSFRFVQKLQSEGLMPEEVSGALVGTLFNEGNAAMVINGPWFLGEISDDIDFGVSPLPTVSETGEPASPFLTDEAAFVSAYARNTDDALMVARYLSDYESAKTRALVGRQIVAHKKVWELPEIANDPVLTAFRDQLSATTPMDNRPEMRNVWEPAQLALKKALRGGEDPAAAARAAQRRLQAITRPPPPQASITIYVVLGIGLALGMLALVLRRWTRFARTAESEGRGVRKEVGRAARAWTWVSPAMGVTAILIFLPFVVGLVLSLFVHREGDWTFVGLANFGGILASRFYGPMEPLSFYYALTVTVLWTTVNLALHVCIGLSLALVLNRPMMKLKPVYRVLLILPWAVPNYITALIWKGLFHKQFGAINGLLQMLGIEGVAWFSKFWTAFFANVCTNAWLGFPFMMVVSLGALQSIPRDLYEAADVDGAGWWSKLRHITLPLLTPAMIPAMLLGTVWTFNQFNIVYLVSGGEPDNATDILISEAYRWAFDRQEQYGYAAAYAALIFLFLLGWSLVSARLARKAEVMA